MYSVQWINHQPVQLEQPVVPLGHPLSRREHCPYPQTLSRREDTLPIQNRYYITVYFKAAGRLAYTNKADGTLNPFCT